MLVLSSGPSDHYPLIYLLSSGWRLFYLLLLAGIRALPRTALSSSGVLPGLETFLPHLRGICNSLQSLPSFHGMRSGLSFFTSEYLFYLLHLLHCSKVDLGNYSRNDIIYSADKLLEAGFIEGTKIKTIGSGPPGIRITTITWSGHQFLDNIRDNKVWKHTKSIVKDFSSVSLSTILNVSSQVISLLIKDKMNLF